MNKKQLYFIIAILSILLVYILFFTQENEKINIQNKDILIQTQETVATGTETSYGKESILEEYDKKQEEIKLEGTFVGFVDGADVYKKTFKYLLLNDGSEVLRIDLRPLVGYSDIDVLQKLGVKRGAQVVVKGIMQDTAFKITSITPQ